MADDPFPRHRIAALGRRMPAYLRLSWRLAKDPLLSKARRAAVVGAAGYLASPIDLVPGVIPLLGQLDDIAVAIAALRIALAGLSFDQRQVHLEAVGLRDQDLADDLRTIGATTAWIGRATYRSSKRVVVASGRVAAAGAGAAARTTRSAAQKAAPTARAVANRAATAAPAAKAMADKAAPATRAMADKAAPAAKAVADKAGPAARATGRAAKDAGTRAAGAGGRALGAAGAALGKMPRPGRSRDPEVLVTEVDLLLLPPPPPERAKP
jgi:uncharacterized membrane protein YkvA (DUF1232 family)